MCGRFTLSAPASTIADVFSVDGLPELIPRYNVAPSQQVLGVRVLESARTASLFRWGLVPRWAKDVKIGYRMINARSETASSKPSFKAPFRRRRLLVVADGFFEWRRSGSKKLPIYFHLTNATPFAMAGLWERWRGTEGEVIESCTVLTTEANPLVGKVHNRMPVILPPEQWLDWLNPENQDVESLQRMMVPLPADQMTARAVNPRVNNVRNDDAACIEPWSETTLWPTS